MRPKRQVKAAILPSDAGRTVSRREPGRRIARRKRDVNEPLTFRTDPFTNVTQLKVVFCHFLPYRVRCPQHVSINHSVTISATFGVYSRPNFPLFAKPIERKIPILTREENFPPFVARISRRELPKEKRLVIMTTLRRQAEMKLGLNNRAFRSR